MTDNNPIGADVYTPYFFIMTVQLRDGYRITLTNTVSVSPGDSRAHVFGVVRSWVAHDLREDGFTVLFFSMEPNRF